MSELPTDEQVSALVGKTETVAKATVLDSGWIWRVVSKDGKHFMKTSDVKRNRINATIDNSVVTKASIY